MKKAWMVAALAIGAVSADDRLSLAEVEGYWNQYGRQEANRWFPFGSNNEIDLKTISRQSGKTFVWVRATPSPDSPVREAHPTADHYLMRVAFDCVRGVVGPAGIVVYDNAGKSLDSDTTPDYQISYQPVVPATRGEFQYEMVCG